MFLLNKIPKTNIINKGIVNTELFLLVHKEKLSISKPIKHPDVGISVSFAGWDNLYRNHRRRFNKELHTNGNKSALLNKAVFCK